MSILHFAENLGKRVGEKEREREIDRKTT